MEKKESISIQRFFYSLWWVFKIFWNTSKFYTVISIITGIIIELLTVLNTYMFARGIDTLIDVSVGDRETIWIYYIAGIFFGISFLQSSLRLIHNYVSRMLSSMYTPYFQTLTYRKLISIGIEKLEDPDINNLIERTRRNSGRIEFVFDQLNRMSGSLSSIIASGAIIIAFAPQLIPISIIVLVPAVLIDRIYMRKMWRYNRELTEESRSAYQSSGYLQDSKSLLELTITGGHKMLSKKFESFIQKWLLGISNIRRSWYSYIFLFNILRAVIQVYVNVFVFLKFLAHQISIGNVTFYIRQVANFIDNIDSLASITNSMYEASLNVDEAIQLFELPNIDDGSIRLERLKEGPEIKMEDVTFAYPSNKKTILKNINLNIKSGEKIAIVGENGAGKTTLVKLLMRFYKVNSGKVSVNGNDVNELMLDDYYKNVSVLFQDYNTYTNLRLKDNIFIGKPYKKFSKKKMVQAADYADIHEFVASYKNGFDQILSEKFKGGIRPSTGQWQKISIARFFYRNAPLVIFDEPTASIDAISERKIFDRIYNSFKGKTTIIISHRFSTVRNADRIIVLDGGKIVEEGSHDKLMRLGGVYATSFKLQAQGYQ